MGYLESFAQRTFAEETERITGGAVGWQDPPEIRFERVQSDGLLVIRAPHSLAHLTAPWSEAQHHSEVMLELKLTGNHLDRAAVERALLRRLARQVQRLEDEDPSWLGDEPLWLVAPHVPGWLDRKHKPVRFAPGCYCVEQRWRSFLWIAANELPLLDELVPFLTARSGQALDDFGRWAVSRRPAEWMLNMLKYLPMSIPSREDLLRRLGPVDDPEIEERRQHILDFLLKMDPKTTQRLEDKGQLVKARDALRRVLLRRQLSPGEGDDARIEACNDLATLDRWLDQAVTAASVSDALA